MLILCRRAHACAQVRATSSTTRDGCRTHFVVPGRHTGFCCPPATKTPLRRQASRFTSETYTSAAGSCKEDIGCVSNAAWILDGATSLSRRTLLDANGQPISDAAHLVATLSAAVHREWDLGRMLRKRSTARCNR